MTRYWFYRKFFCQMHLLFSADMIIDVKDKADTKCKSPGTFHADPRSFMIAHEGCTGFSI
jgi:hypothetical protein